MHFFFYIPLFYTLQKVFFLLKKLSLDNLLHITYIKIKEGNPKRFALKFGLLHYAAAVIGRTMAAYFLCFLSPKI